VRAELDALVAQADGALIVVTTASQNQRAGCLVGFHVQCSIEPFRYAIWLSQANHTYRVALFATHYAVHFLGEENQELAELFGTTSGDREDKFSHCAWTAGAGGVPVLTGVPAVVFERVTLWNDGSDHVCLVGEPVAVQTGSPFRPLRLSGAERLQAGHAAEDRPVPNLVDPHEPTDDGDEVERLQGVAAGFGHLITSEQAAGLVQEHRQAEARDGENSDDEQPAELHERVTGIEPA
jgi:flavin reductase (DIM6/NTAB) family NADH-FMN oxidoreductase RutF